MQQATCVIACGNTLGEGIVWDADRQCLYWTDIQAATLWRYSPVGEGLKSWCLPDRLACFALCRDPDWLLLGLAAGLAFFHLPTGRLEHLEAVEPELPTRINDGACDREGRFVFGTMHEADDGAPRPLASFYRLNADLSLQRLPLPRAAITNSLAFSPDGRVLYFCDSLRRSIQRCAYAENGHLGAPDTFVDLSHLSGMPDGSTVDARGGLWNAQWGTGCVVRYTPDGKEDQVITVPASQVTKPAFGGDGLRQLFMTSAHEGLSGDARRRELQAGHVFSIAVGVRGLPETRFAGRHR